MKNYTDTIISQYAQSPTINRLIDNVNAYLDPQIDIDNFLLNIWDIQTANGAGLDIWGKIVGVGRILKIPSLENVVGFSQQTDDNITPFNDGVFYIQGIDQYNTLSLLDEPYRKLIMIKALSNISRSTPQAINYILTQLFGGQIRKTSFIDGTRLDSDIILDQTVLGEKVVTESVPTNRCYVADHNNMSIGLVFEFDLEPWEYALLSQTNVLPIPAGVGAKFYQISDTTFGFLGADDYAAPFNDGTFMTENIVYAV